MRRNFLDTPFLFRTFGRIRVLRRQKLSGAGTHDGLQLLDGRVIDITSDGGVRVRSFEEFASGREVTEVREIAPRLHGQVMRNVHQVLMERRPYHATDWNCEILVNALICEKPESPSVKGLALLALAVGAVALLARA